MIVVIDTNIWVGNSYLRAGAGAAVRFYLHKKNARLGLPEVIRLEVEQHLKSDAQSSIDKIRGSFNKLLAIFGTLKQVALPTSGDVTKKATEIFEDFGVEVVTVPFSLESARDSFLRTIHKVVPSHRSQQFKDGVIWADCLTLLKQDDVVLVTADAAFYENFDLSKGLSVELSKECAPYERSLKIMSDLPQLLDEIRSDVKIDFDKLSTEFLGVTSVDKILDRTGFERGRRSLDEAELFVTENPHVLFLKFKFVFECRDLTDKGRTKAFVMTRGDGVYESAKEEFFDLGELGTELHFQDADGSPQRRANVIARIGSAFMGHADEYHVVREKIDT